MAKIIGYNVYRSADGCAESFYGFAKTIDEAKDMASTGNRMEECMYSTAVAAGHCAGIKSPDKSNEDSEVAEWFGVDGYDCAVAVYATEEARKVIEIYVDSVWAGSGTLLGSKNDGHQIVDCGAQFCDDSDESEAVYESIEDAIDCGGKHVAFRGQGITWEIT